MIVSYEDEGEALAVVGEAVARHGSGYVAGLALSREDDRGKSSTLAEGAALLDYVEATADLPLPVR